MALVVGSALLASACAGSAATTTTDAPMSTTEQTPVATTGSSMTTTTIAVGTTQSEGGGSGSDCLVGTWTLDTEAFVHNFDPIFADAGIPDAEVTPLGGAFIIELEADGSLTGTREEWGFTFVTDQGNFTLQIDGTETGTWSAEASTLSVTTDSSDLDVAASIEVNGQVIEMPGGDLPIPVPEGIASDSQYDCSGDTLTLTNGGVESILHRG